MFKECLTDKEKEVLALVAEGYDNNTIAEIMYVTVHTVTTHLGNIYRKYGDYFYEEYGEPNRIRIALAYLRENRTPICDGCEVADNLSTLIYDLTNGRMSYSCYTLKAMQDVIDEVREEEIEREVEPYKKVLEEVLKMVKDYESNIGFMDYTGQNIVDAIEDIL